MKMKRSYLSIQYKALGFFSLMIILPLVVVGSLSYLQSSAAFKQQISEFNLNTVSQVAASIEGVLNETMDNSMYLLANEDIKNYLIAGSKEDAFYEQHYFDAYKTLIFLFASKPYYKSTYLESYNGISTDTSGADNTISQAIYEKIDALKGRYYWYKNQIMTYDGKTENVYSLIRLYKNYTNQDELGVIKINISEDHIIEIMTNKTIGDDSGYFVVDNQGNVITGTTDKDFSWIQRNLSSLSEDEGYFETEIDSDAYLITYDHIESADWLIVNYFLMDELLENNQAIKEFTVIVVFICIIACLILLIWFLTYVIRPIKKMSLLMKNIENEDFDVYIETRGNDEFTVLAENFNKMSSKLKQLITKEYNLRISQREAELKALQAQINPHFLYNSLDLICWMSRIKKDYETAEVVEALSKMFRLNLNSGEEITTVERELNHLENYIIIQQKRYEGMIDFRINVQKDILDAKTVKLILQPMVENAIYHGIEPMGGEGIVWIDIFEKDETLIYQIRDNGIGADIEEVEHLLVDSDDDYSNRGFAIRNVNERIKLYYSDLYGIKFSRLDMGGTSVTITQPLTKREQSHV